MSKAKHSICKNSGPIEIRQFLTFRLSRIQAKLNAQAAAVLSAQSDLSLVEWRVISMVANFGEGTSATLSKEAEIDKGLFSRKLKRLESAGYIGLKPNPDDQRQQILYLKKKGKTTYDYLIKIMRKRQEFLVEEFSEEELQILNVALDKLETSSERRKF